MIEQINGTTFRVPLGDDFVEIGNKDATKFKPHIMLPRWSSECKFKLLFPSVQIAAPKITKDKNRLQYRVGDIGFDWYAIPPNGQHDGALEQEITLFSRPPSNELRLPYEADGLSLHHQPPLTQKEIDEGCERPDNVINSIAAHHSTKSGHEIGKTNYMAGIAFHLFRGQATDSNGWKVWVDKFLDLDHHEIVYLIPYDFWLNAQYPVRHALGDTFGYTTVGGSSIARSADNARGPGTAYTGAAGTGTSMSIYAKNSGDNVKMALYKDSDSALVGETDPVAMAAAAGWKSANFVSNPTLSAIDYILAFKSDAEIQVYYNALGVSPKFVSNAYADPWPNPISWSAVGNATYSIYCTYTPGAAANAMPMAMNHYRRLREV